VFDFSQYGFSQEASERASSFLAEEFNFDEGAAGQPKRNRVCRRKDGSVYGISAGKRCRKGSEDYTVAQRVKDLEGERMRLGQRLMKVLTRERPDGGTYMEHPDEKHMKLIDAVGARVKSIDDEINKLEGKKPGTKRWVEGDPFGLTKFSDYNSPARQRYEQEIINNELKSAKKGDQAVFMSGGPASGKTSLLKKQFGKADGFAVVDPDRLKDFDPVMRVGVAMGMRQAAALAHENSSRLSKDLFSTARDRKVNILMDGTGANADKYIKQMQDLQGKGYKVTLLAQHVPQAVGVKRALARADKVGRYVPPEFIRHAYEVIPGNFERMARVADRATLNNGESNATIMQFEKGKQSGGDSRLATAYRRKYGTGD
jgi:predicted ABC-type ATPase